MTYDPAMEGARLALEAATRSLADCAEQLYEDGNIGHPSSDVAIEDVRDWIVNWLRALRLYRCLYPVEKPAGGAS